MLTNRKTINQCQELDGEVLSIASLLKRFRLDQTKTDRVVKEAVNSSDHSEIKMSVSRVQSRRKHFQCSKRKVKEKLK